jgi:hypothetical protein
MSENNEQLQKLRKAKPTTRLVLAIIFVILGATNLGAKDGPGIGILLILVGGFFGWRYWVESQLLKNAPAELLAQVKGEQAEKAKAIATKSAVSVKYQAGLDEMSLSGIFELLATDKALVLVQGGIRREIPWSEMESVEAGTEDELRARLTLTRVALIGIFALGAKKEKKQDFFVSITTKNAMGLFDLVAKGKNKEVLAKAKAFSVSCNSKIRAAQAQ